MPRTIIIVIPDESDVTPAHLAAHIRNAYGDQCESFYPPQDRYNAEPHRIKLSTNQLAELADFIKAHNHRHEPTRMNGYSWRWTWDKIPRAYKHARDADPNESARNLSPTRPENTE